MTQVGLGKHRSLQRRRNVSHVPRLQTILPIGGIGRLGIVLYLVVEEKEMYIVKLQSEICGQESETHEKLLHLPSQVGPRRITCC